MISPHGGKLINQLLSEKQQQNFIDEFSEMPQIPLNSEQIEDVYNICNGVYSPLKGFMLQEEVNSIIKNDHLSNGLAWTIPILFDVSKKTAEQFQEGETIALTDNEQPLAFFNLEEKYTLEKEKIAKSIFQTLDSDHPGVAKIMNSNPIALGGTIKSLPTNVNKYKNVTFYPRETRKIFKERNWEKIVGFQTRNVPHLGHEYIQKTALTLVDGLFINPIIGKKKKNDFLDPVILGAYKVLMDNYYRRDKATLGILRTRMRYAGPKEAVFHAIMRKNFGCSHFIVGRDHAGVSDYYGPFDAHQIFERFPDLKIEPICFRSFFLCSKCGGVVNDNTCPHNGTKYQEFISGTKIRQLLRNKQKNELKSFMRQEVIDFLINQKELFVK